MPLEDAGVLGGGDEGRRVGDSGWAWQDRPGSVVEAQGQRVTCGAHVCPSQGPGAAMPLPDRTWGHSPPLPTCHPSGHSPTCALSLCCSPIPVLLSCVCPWFRHHYLGQPPSTSTSHSPAPAQAPEFSPRPLHWSPCSQFASRRGTKGIFLKTLTVYTLLPL